MEGGSCGNVATCLKAGSPSTLDVPLQKQWGPLAGEGHSQGRGFFTGWRETPQRASQPSPSRVTSPPNPPQGSKPGRAVWAKATPLPLLPGCLFWVGCSTRRRAVQAEGTFHLTFSSAGQGPCVPVRGSPSCTQTCPRDNWTTCPQKPQHRSFHGLLPGPEAVPQSPFLSSHLSPFSWRLISDCWVKSLINKALQVLGWR